VALQQVLAVRAARRGWFAGPAPTLAVDATGFEAHHVSAHYGYRYSARYRAAYAALHGGREPRRRHQRPCHPKLTLAIHTASHFIFGARPGWGPTHDLLDFTPVVRQAVALWQAARHAVPAQVRRLHALVADAGYDAEAAHVLCREELGVRTTAIRLNRRRTSRRWPKTRYRRALRRRFPWRLYHRRQQVESVFSRVKRRLGAALTARTAATQMQELLLRVLTHNLLLLYARLSFQQSR
jgi:hypothetical protein